MKKVAIYIRVSTQEQALEGYSISAQKDKLIAYCKAKNWLIHDIYIDGGYSGSNIDRPAIKQLLENINNFDLVLVYKLDRLSRSQRDTLFLIEEKFLANNIDFVSLSESFDTSTPFGRAMIGILAVFAQLERENIKERSRMGRAKRVEKGYWRGGANVPTGYNYIAEKNELIIDEYESKLVKEIFKLYNEGCGYNNVARTLNEKGLLKNNGSIWRANAVRRILNNPIYCGKMEYFGEVHQGNHEAIISEELFNQTQKLLKHRSTDTVTTSQYLLGGMVFCGYCGARLRPYKLNRKKYNRVDYYFICYSKMPYQHMIVDPNCPARNVRMDAVESYVENEIKKLSLNREQLTEAYYKENIVVESAISADTIKKRISDLDKQIKKLMDLYQLDDIPFDEISERIKNLNSEKTKLLQQIVIDETAITSDEISLDEILNFLDMFDIVWEQATTEERKIILHQFIDRIVVKDADNIKIVWNF